MADGEGRRGCGWCLGVGCALVVSVLIIMAVLVAMNWGRVQGWIEQGTETFGTMLSVQGEIAEAFPCSGTSVNIHVGGGQRTLKIGLSRPTFDPAPYGGWEGAALAVAELIAERHPELLDVDQVVVQFAQESGAVTTEHRYAFPVDQLLQPPTPLPAEEVPAVDG